MLIGAVQTQRAVSDATDFKDVSEGRDRYVILNAAVDAWRSLWCTASCEDYAAISYATRSSGKWRVTICSGVSI
jgi:hypothetical protein